MANQISPEARADYDALLQSLLPFAEQMLKKHGEFYPFAMAVTTTGEVTAIAAHDGQEMPPAEQVLNSLIAALRSEASAGRIRAAGICSNGRIALEDKETDAIIGSLEHVGGETCKACVPYKKGLFGGYKLGNLTAGRSEPRIFVGG